MGKIRGNNMVMSAMIAWCIVIIALSITTYVANAADPSPLQDFCVGVDDPHLSVSGNGMFCKHPKYVTVDDFIYKGFNVAGDTNNVLGSIAVQANATTFPALNTLGLAMLRLDFAPGGVNPPHLHPRASEMFVVVKGSLYLGFVTANLRSGANKLYSKVLKEGDVFAFPQGLIHFQRNIGKTPAVAHVAFSSQNPGLNTIANAVFGSTPPIMDDVLIKAFQVDEKIIESLRCQFSSEDQSQNYVM